MHMQYHTIPSSIMKTIPVSKDATRKSYPVWEPGKDHQSLTARLIKKGFRPVTHKHCAGQGCFLCQNVGIVWVNPVNGHGAIVEYNEQGFLVDAVI